MTGSDGALKRNKVQITLRVDADVLDEYRALGKGYQRAMNDALRSALRKRGDVRREWTPVEDDYLAQHYRALGGRQCAIRLGRSQMAIHHRASYLGLTNGEEITD